METARRTILLRALLGTVVFLAGCQSPTVRNPAETSTPPLRLRILTYNIHHGRGLDGEIDLPRIAAVITRLNPDLVALQEVDNMTTRAGGVDQAAELARLTNMNHAYGKAMDYSGGQYGEAILSRFDLIDASTHPLPHSTDREPRAALAIRVRLAEDLEIVFIGTHLDHLSDETDRMRQAQRINEIAIAQYGDDPVILAGDLNAEPDSETMQEFLEVWSDASSASPMPTFPSVNPARRIDYILFRSEGPFRVVTTQVITGEEASDHCPVLAVVEFMPRTNAGEH